MVWSENLGEGLLVPGKGGGHATGWGLGVGAFSLGREAAREGLEDLSLEGQRAESSSPPFFHHRLST